MVDAHQEANAIFQPIKKRLPIKAFSYVRYFLDGKRLFVTDDERLHPHLDWVFRKTPTPKLPECTPCVSRVSNSDALVLTTSFAMKDFYEAMLSDLFAGFQLGCAFSILQRKQKYYEEFIFFPALNDPKSYSTLFSNQDLLQHAMFLFLDKAHESMKSLKTFQTSAQSFEEEIAVSKAARQRLLEETTARHFYIDADSDTYLTRKEAACAYYLTQNMTSIQIAAEMGISKRTAEDHVENMKLKCGISNKFDLIQFLMSNGFNRLSTLTEL